MVFLYSSINKDLCAGAECCAIGHRIPLIGSAVCQRKGQNPGTSGAQSCHQAHRRCWKTTPFHGCVGTFSQHLHQDTDTNHAHLWVIFQALPSFPANTWVGARQTLGDISAPLLLNLRSSSPGLPSQPVQLPQP